MKMKSMLMGALALGCACAFGGENPTEKTRKAIAELFPGWSLETEVTHDLGGFHANHRGQDNVVFVHPKSMETPAVISRTVTLSDKNPCLFLKVASWGEEADYLLSVRVNGKDALPTRLITTSDSAPWEDIVVPLSVWRGSEAKIEVVLTANNWWCEAAYLARMEIAEGNGDMSIVEGKVAVGEYKWSFRAQNGEATIIAETDGQFSCAISPCPIGDISIPATLGGAKVTRIGRCAFKDCSGLTSVTFPEGVTHIGRDAFRECTGLQFAKIPSSVKVIEWDAFGGCNALKSLTLPAGLTNIERGAFHWCCGPTSVTIPASVTHIGQDAFAWCRALTSVTIPSKVTDVAWGTFRGCNALTSAMISASVTNVNFTAFCDCPALTSIRVEEGNLFYKSENGLLLTKDGTTLVRGVNGDVKIPASVTAIGPCAFEGAVALRAAVIPSGVKSIGDYAFKQCRGMTAVMIPPSVTSIGREAFSTCRGLKSVMIPKGVTVIRNSTFSCSGLTEVTIPPGVKTLERGAFSWCGDLKAVTFPEGLTSIGRDAFYNCGKLSSVTIPTSVTRIEQGAFHGCGSLTSVTIPATLTNNIDRTAFDGCSKLKSVNLVKDGKTESMTFDEFCKQWKQGRLGLLGRSLRERCLQRQQQVQTTAAKQQSGQSATEAQRQAQAEADRAQREAERAEQRQQLQAIQEELKRVRAAKATEGCRGCSQTEKKNRVEDSSTEKISVAEKFQSCDFLLNKDFKKNAKYYLCLFSASWCGPCRAEMPRIAKTYAETLKADPDIELIHFSRDKNDEKALAWAKEHDVKFPVVKPNGGNPLNLQSRGIPHLFIVRADGTLVEEGHPSKLFSEEKLRALVGKTGKAMVNGCAWTYCASRGEATIVSPTGKLYERAVSPEPTGDIVIPSSFEGASVTRIGKFALCNCSDLISVKIPSGVTGIGEWAFSGCANLTSVTVPASVTSIRECVFASCPQLLKIGLAADNPTYKVVEGVLYTRDMKHLVTCPGGLSSVTIPVGVTDIDAHAFRCCRNLKSVTIPSGVKVIGIDAFCATLLTSIVIPSTVESIGNAAFFCCAGMKFVELGEGVKSIGGRAFYQCWGLTSVTIPASVKDIGFGAFEDCKELTAVTMCGERPNSRDGVFNKCNKLSAIHVPAKAKSWAGMKEWQGIPLVFDGAKAEG